MAGSALGWAALGLTAAAAAFHRWDRGQRPSPHSVGLLGMAVLGLLASTIHALWPEWGYRALMLGWGAYALLVALCTWWAASTRALPGRQGPPQDLIRLAAVWVRGAGLAAVLLGLKAALWHDLPYERLWAAAAIALASAAGVTMAAWQRREDWAFLGSMGVHLAASLVVWHFHRELSFDAWWMTLLEANAIAGASVALIWTTARKRLLELGQPPQSAPATLLGLQVALGVAANVVLWGLYAGWLFVPPAISRRWPRDWRACPVRWRCCWLRRRPAATCGRIIPAAWSTWRAPCLGGSLDDERGAGTAGRLGNLAAVSARGDDRPGSGRASGAGRRLAGAKSARPAAGRLAIDAWVCGIAALAGLLAVVHNGGDPHSPWWSAGTILGASVLFGLLSLSAAVAGGSLGRPTCTFRDCC